MQWYYKWKLKNIQKEISILEVLASHPLVDDYTAKSRLRTLNRLAAHIEERLTPQSSPSVQH